MRKPDCIYGERKHGIGIDVNCIYKAFELIGVLESYIADHPANTYDNFDGEEFLNYYRFHTLIPRFRYRNIGISIIHRKLYEQNERTPFVGLSDLEFFFTTKSLKRTGIWFGLSKSRVYEGTDLIVKAIISYINESYLNDLYYNIDKGFYKDDVSQYLLFQYECLIDYVSGPTTGRKLEYYTTMKTTIEDLF